MLSAPSFVMDYWCMNLYKYLKKSYPNNSNTRWKWSRCDLTLKVQRQIKICSN